VFASKRSTSKWAPVAPDPRSELHILGLDGDSLGVDGAQVRVLEEVDKEVLNGVLKCEHGLTLPAGEQKSTSRSLKCTTKSRRDTHKDGWNRKQIVCGAPVTIIVKP
jgi:hypothetical protein